MENFLLLSILGVLVIYFYGNMNLYKSMYQGMIKEKELLEERIDNLEKLKEKLEKQVEHSIATVKESQESLEATREAYQELKLENTELEHKNKVLQERVSELYASVGTIR
jgi:peptidoglycan hydrolase CwlO-like protein